MLGECKVSRSTNQCVSFVKLNVQKNLWGISWHLQLNNVLVSPDSLRDHFL